MKAILLAAGESSRIYPLVNGEHKSMIKLLGKPLLEHTINMVKSKNINDIVMVVNNNDSIEKYFGNGKAFGVSITYIKQLQPLGAGNAVLLAHEKIQVRENFLLLNAYHVEMGNQIDKLVSAKNDVNDGVLLVKQRENVSNYGVIEVEKGRVKRVVEKPKIGEEPSKLSIIGIYLLSAAFINVLKETPAQHYQLEAALDRFAKDYNVSFVQTDEETIVLKFPWDLFNVKNYLLSTIGKYISPISEISDSAKIIGDVYIEDGVKIMENAVIKGPCYLGKNSFVGNNSVLRGGVDLEENVVVGANMEMKNTIVLEGSKTHSGFIGDSIIGKNCRVGAGFISANVRLDRSTVKTIVKDNKVDTGLRDFGTVVGDDTHIGTRSSTMPGILIGKNVVIGPSTVVMSNIKDDSKYYTKLKEIITKNR